MCNCDEKCEERIASVAKDLEALRFRLGFASLAPSEEWPRAVDISVQRAAATRARRKTEKEASGK